MITIYHKMNEQERTSLAYSLAEYLRDDNNISFAYLYGSFKDYDDAVGFRDIDIALYVTGGKDALDYALEKSAGMSHKYNLPVECVPFNNAPLFLDMMEETVTDALDFMPLRQEAMRELV
ncbi:MAG: nucleotidyltransferase domain-containing protein [Deltaproteobacteria bacterium]|nr:nucleotidyltransferase domain-containing protein [Deltaproteobacteria bacterium]